MDIQHFYRPDRYSVLPAYTMDGWLLGALIKLGSIKTGDFMLWLQQEVLSRSSLFPSARSIIIMDNCLTYKRLEVYALCRLY